MKKLIYYSAGGVLLLLLITIVLQISLIQSPGSRITIQNADLAAGTKENSLIGSVAIDTPVQAVDTPAVVFVVATPMLPTPLSINPTVTPISDVPSLAPIQPAPIQPAPIQPASVSTDTIPTATIQTATIQTATMPVSIAEDMSWAIDPAHSAIDFSVRHMMLSLVSGEFERFSGTVNLNVENPEQTTVDIQIAANSINTNESQRDDHLKSPDFLDADTYPYVAFKSSSVQRTGDTTAKMTGDLTIRDVTKSVTLDVTYKGYEKSPLGTTSIGFAATTNIDRREWGLIWNQALETGGIFVGNEVAISIEMELLQKDDAWQEAYEEPEYYDYVLAVSAQRPDCLYTTLIVQKIVEDNFDVVVPLDTYNNMSELFANYRGLDKEELSHISLCFLDPVDREQLGPIGDWMRLMGSGYWQQGSQRWYVALQSHVTGDMQAKHQCLYEFFQNLDFGDTVIETDDPNTWIREHQDVVASWLKCGS